MNLPADIANQALDAAGIDFSIGDLEEGTKPAQVMLRAYGQCLRQLTRAAHWDFCRKQVPAVLLADATRQTPNVSTNVPVPWLYEYAYPIDCMKVRFVPYNYGVNPAVPAGNIAIPSTPMTTAPLPQTMTGGRLRPARFLVGTDPNIVPQPGQQFWEVQGSSPQGSTVILTNVRAATIIYSALMQYPSVWDALFRAAFVAFLAAEVALPLAKMSVVGVKGAMALRKDNIEIAKAKIKEARAVDGNEGWYSSDIRVDWIEQRRSGGWGASRFTGEGGMGSCWGGWDACSFADGSAY